MGCSSKVLLKPQGFTGLLLLCSLHHFSPHPPPLVIMTVLREPVAAALSASGPVSGQGDETREVTLAPPSELQRLSSAHHLLALLSALTKTKERLQEARHAAGSES